MASQRDDNASGSAKGDGDRSIAQQTVVVSVPPSAPSAPPAAQSPSGDSTDGTSQDEPTQPDPSAGQPQVVATLAAIEGDLKGDAFVLHAGENHLGRGVDCSPVLNSRWISRSHATLVCDGDRMSIRATDGKELMVNDVAVTSQDLADGDLIRMGTTVLILRTVSPGDVVQSSVIRVATEGSGEHKVPSAVPPVQPSAGPPPSPSKAAARPASPATAKRKKSWWKFWVKPTPSLVFVRGARAGERIALNSARVRIGGLQDNEVVITGHDASRNHAELRVRDGRVHIWDLRSVNGTWVNEERIENKELRFGDVIRIGSEELRFED